MSRCKDVLPGFGLISLLVVCSLFYRLGSWGVIDTSEARYAEISRKMVERGDFIHPVYLGIEHYHKPPMTYWITSLSYTLFGVNPFAARMFLQVAFLIQIGLVYRIAYGLYEDQKAAVYGAAIYASLLIVVISIRNLTTDAYLTTFLLAAISHALTYLKSYKPKHIYAFALFGAFAFLTKITAVFVYLGPVLLLLLWHFRSKLVFSWHQVSALVAGLVCTLAWFIVLQLEGKEVLKYMLYDQSVVRYSSDTFNRSMPIYFYLVATMVLSVPWIYLTIYRLSKDNETGAKIGTDLIFFLTCFLLPIAFFSLSQSKLLLYILPAFWVLAILSGKYLSQINNQALQIWVRIQFGFHLIVLISLLVVPFIDQDLVFPILFYVWWVVALVLTIVFAFMRGPTSRLKLLYSSLSFTSLILLMSSHFLSENEMNASTGKLVVEWLQNKGLDERPVYLFNKLAPSFAFHLQKDVSLIGSSVKRELEFENNTSWKDYYFDVEIDERKKALLERLTSPSVLVSRRNRVSNIDAKIIEKFSNQHEIGLWKIFY